MSKPESVDYVVVGAGIAGLRAAIELAEHGRVLVVTKEALGESNTFYAQGGIAVAMSGEEDSASHLKDTLYAGDGLVYRPAAEALVSEGPLRVEELIAWGTNFDRGNAEQGAPGQLLMGREAAHSLPRILHANGDATGAEISRALLVYAKQQEKIRFADWTTATRLLVNDVRVVGVDLLAEDHHGGSFMRRVAARAVMLASGGAGQVFSDTTNPAVATGDGIALAIEAGAELADMEFYQFHPTALALPGVPRFLISEAVRGEGAYLRNSAGERFMDRYHPLLELAPRDVVARAIAREGMGPDSEALPVYLDLRHLKETEPGLDLVQRFPGISRFLAQHGLLLSRDLIPVRPAAHYLMGGVRTDLDGRTTLRGLYAAGEVACTGVHGANRLASNSLLEGLVFGARAAKAILRDSLEMPGVEPSREDISDREFAPGRIADAVGRLRTVMFRSAGLLRDADSLAAGLAEVESISDGFNLGIGEKQTRQLFEARALASVAKSILLAARARTESRGAHSRNDYPKRDDEHFQMHSVQSGNAIRFEAW